MKNKYTEYIQTFLRKDNYNHGKFIKLSDKYNNNENLLKDLLKTLLKNYLYKNLNKSYQLKIKLYFDYTMSFKWFWRNYRISFKNKKILQN